MENSLQIRFKPEKTDYIHASRALATQSPVFIALAAFTGLIVLLSMVILIFPSIGGGDFKSAAVMALIIGGFYFLYYLFLIPMQLSRAYAKNEYLQEERILTFSESHITMQVGSRSSEMDWENVEKVMSDQYLYIMTYKAQEKAYPFIPKRAFSEQGSESEFLKLLDEKSITIK